MPLGALCKVFSGLHRDPRIAESFGVHLLNLTQLREEQLCPTKHPHQLPSWRQCPRVSLPTSPPALGIIHLSNWANLLDRKRYLAL